VCTDSWQVAVRGHGQVQILRNRHATNAPPRNVRYGPDRSAMMLTANTNPSSRADLQGLQVLVGVMRLRCSLRLSSSSASGRGNMLVEAEAPTANLLEQLRMRRSKYGSGSHR